MNSTIVKELLTKHFGSPQDSLTLSKSRKQGVQPQDLKNLAQLDAKTVSDAVTLPLFYETFWADVFLSEYYKSIFAYLGLPGSLAAEYVRLCKKTGAKFHIGCGRFVFENHLRELKKQSSACADG